MATNVPDLQREVKSLSENTVYVFNPTTKDFRCKYGGEEYIVPANDMAPFKEHIANHIKKHLVTFIMNKRGVKSTLPEKRKKIWEEVRAEV